MQLDTQWVKFAAGAAEGQGYFSRPHRATRPIPGVVLIHEAFGVDAFIRDIVERLAAAGYAVLAPDLFSFGGKPIALAPDRVERARAFLDTIPPPAWFDLSLRAQALAKLSASTARELDATLAALLPSDRPWGQYLAALGAAFDWLAQGASHGRKIGALGFCVGGALSLRFACVQPQLSSAVSFYGFAPPLDQVPNISARVLALHAENDPRVNATLAPLADAMAAHGKRFEHQLYAGAGHAFFNDTRANYDVDAARDAWGRALGFLAQTLG